MWSRLALVALGGALGAVARHVISGWVSQWTATALASDHPLSGLPWGTLLVNLVGSAVLGLLMAASLGPGGWVPEPYRLLIGTGFLGALTTFSTFSVETLAALQAGETKTAVVYVVLSVVGGLSAAALGWSVGQRL